jgi:hypothetical protein
MVSIKGKVIDQTTEAADEHLKRLAKRYVGIGKYYPCEQLLNVAILFLLPLISLKLHHTQLM